MSFVGMRETELLRLAIDQHGFHSGLKRPLDLYDIRLSIMSSAVFSH